MAAEASQTALTLSDSLWWVIVGVTARWALWNPGIDWWRELKAERKDRVRIRLYGEPATGEVTGVKVLELDAMLESSPTLEMWDEEVSRWVPIT